MPNVDTLIRSEEDGSLSFGNYSLAAKEKREDFEHAGDSYKVKTFRELTKLERNGAFVYESVPGTAVSEFVVTNNGVHFNVEGEEDVQITLQLDDDTEYQVYVDDVSIGNMTTNLSGKLVVGVELSPGCVTKVRILRRQGA